MKELVKIVCGLLGIVAFIMMLGFVGNIEATDKIEATVMKVNNNNEIEVYDFDGHHWFRISGQFDLRVGEVVELKVATNGNDVASDDTVLKVNGKKASGARCYIGYYEDFGDPIF